MSKNKSSTGKKGKRSKEKKPARVRRRPPGYKPRSRKKETTPNGVYVNVCGTRVLVEPPR